MINSKEFDKKWINIIHEDRKNYTILKLSEKHNIRNEIKDDLIETIINYYIPSKRINRLRDDEKFSKLENTINELLPDKNHEKIRKGDFGEIISSEHLKQRHNYYFSYPKLFFKHNPNTSLNGDDILAFKVKDENIIALCLGEVKVRKKYTNAALNEAYSQLESSYSPNPKSLNLIINDMYRTGNDLAYKLDNLLETKKFDKLKKDNWIFIISENKPNKFSFNQPINLDNLTIVSFHIDDLTNFINELYDSCGEFYNDK